MNNQTIHFLKPAGVAAVCAVLFVAPFATRAKAEAYTERTAVTFSNDVEIPGQMLPAGTYIFQKAPDMAADLNLDIIQIWDATGTRLVATEITIPSILVIAPDHPRVELDESASGLPARLHEFVFQGTTYAHRFVYNDSQEGR
jgi:hypothetical protein